jgi:hypothetical protein
MDIGNMRKPEHSTCVADGRLPAATRPPDERRDDERSARRGWPGSARGLFHTWFLLRRPMTLGARGIVFDRAANSVFLIEHTYVPGWQLPGGGVETGETIGLALERELARGGQYRADRPPSSLVCITTVSRAGATMSRSI